MLFSFPSRYCVRYRSRDVFRVGSWCLPASDANPEAPYSGSLPSYPAQLPLRGFHPLWRAFPGDFGFPCEELGEVLQPHIPRGFRPRVRFALCPLHSPLLRASLLLSLPPGTEMFHFPGFPFAAPEGRERRGFTPAGFPFGHPGFYGCLRLARAFRSWPRPSSALEPSHPPGGLVPRSTASGPVPGLIGFEPEPFAREALPSPRAASWWTRRDSNPGPSACKADALPLSYGPKRSPGLRQIYNLGGDRAAGSPTATLLRLSPSRPPRQRRPQLGDAYGGANFRGLTGGVCKEQGRIHRGIVARDY